MNHERSKYFPAIINFVTEVGVVLLIFLYKLCFPMSKILAKILGLIVNYYICGNGFSHLGRSAP